MLVLIAAIIMAGSALIFPAAALPAPQRGGESRADLRRQISSLEHTFTTRMAEFTAQQRQLEATFEREILRLHAAIDASDTGAGGPLQANTQQHPVARRARLQDNGGGGEGGVSTLCASTAQATTALQTMQTVCCAQRGESCSSSHYPSSCDHGPECGLAVRTVNRLCGPFLQTSIISTTLVPLQQAATLCAATSPPDMVPVHTLSDASRGGTSAPHACFSVLRTQVDGQYRNEWNVLAVLHAPPGFLLSLTWRAFDLDDGDFIEIFENQTAMQARVRAQRLEGSQIPSPFTSESNTMLVKFVTNADGTSFGGSADITCALGLSYLAMCVCVCV
jgi:hypothetical protein